MAATNCMMLPSDIPQYVQQVLPVHVPTGPAERLSGGLLNDVWRVPARPASVILKWYPPYIATQPEIPLPPERGDFEARALSYLATETTGPFQFPRLLHYEESRRILLMEDLGSGKNLSEILLHARVGERDFAALGRHMGTFLGQLHVHTWGKESLQRIFNNHHIQRIRGEVEYRLDLPAHSPQADQMHQHLEELARTVMCPGPCLTMGDFWPEAIHFPVQGKPAVIDWEMAHFGWPFQDYAHMMAHVWMHALLADECRAALIRQLMGAFRQAYQTHTRGIHAELFSARSRSLMGWHAGSEVLQRVMGAFSAGYLFTEASRPIKEQAIEMGTELLLSGNMDWLG